jgi:hypothetical protein
MQMIGEEGRNAELEPDNLTRQQLIVYIRGSPAPPVRKRDIKVRQDALLF